MDKNQDPGKTSRIRNTYYIAKDTVPADGNYVDTNVKQPWDPDSEDPYPNSPVGSLV